MKRKSKIVSALLVVCLCIGCLTACKSDTPSATNSNASTTSQKNLSGKVVYWSMWNENEPQADAIKKAVVLFNKDYPKCTIDITWVGRTNCQTIPPALKGGQKIDIIDNITYTTDPTLFADITSMMKEPAIGQPSMTVEQSIIDVLKVSNKQNQVLAKLSGEYYGVPVSPWTAAFFYNKDLFKKAGITAIPTTWTEFIDACKKLKVANIAALTTDDAYIYLIPNAYLTRLVGQDGIAKLLASTKDALWDDSAILKTLQAMQDISQYTSATVATNKYPAGQQEFALGKAAMYFNASWFPGEVKDTAGPDFPWGAFNFPVVEGGKEDATAISLGCIPMNVTSSSDNKEAAMEFLKYCVSKEVQDSLSANGGYAPCTIGSVWPGAIKDCGALVSTAKSITGFGANLSSDFLKGVYIPQITKVFTKQTNAADALKTIQSQRAKY
jgi:raffinose/stachyose/melibiose transport system substrate-binding protein